MAEISGPTLVSIVRVHPGESLDDKDAASRAKKKTPIVCSPSDTVADIKARYLKNSPQRDRIQLHLKYNGRSLNDTDKIDTVPNGAWLYYESVAMSPKGPRSSNGDLRMRAGGIPALNLSSNGGSNHESPKPDFIADTKGVFKAEGAQALVVAPVMPPAAPKAQNGDAGSASVPRGRTLAYTHTMMVNHCVFRVIHMHEGRWSGDAVVVNPGTGPSAVSLSSDALTFSDKMNRWTSVRSITDTRGFTTKTTFVLTPASDGVMRVDLEGSETSFRMEERGQNILLVTGVDAETGRMRFVETITLLSDMRRVRTSQHFAANGDVSTITYDQTRIIGAVNGAMEPVVD